MLNITKETSLEDVSNVVNQARSFLSQRQGNSTEEGKLRDEVLFATLEYALVQFANKKASDDRYEKYNELWNMADSDPCDFLIAAADPKMEASNFWFSSDWNTMIYDLAKKNKDVVWNKKLMGLLSASVAMTTSGMVVDARLFYTGMMMLLYTMTLYCQSPNDIIKMPIGLDTMDRAHQLLGRSVGAFFSAANRAVAYAGRAPIMQPPRR
jgi:hypothetical protein